MDGQTSPSLTGEEVVISGISGIFPASENVQEFMENLFNKVDMVESSSSDWNFSHPEVPKYVGKIKGMEHFDAQFFKVPFGQGSALDGMSRKLLEHAYGAMFDAGVNPLEMSGSKMGVFVGSSFTDIVAINIFNATDNSNYLISGSSKSMQANRISYWVDAKGPSFGLDTSCSSSIACLTLAYRSLISGQCDSAIVGGCNNCLHPILQLNLKRAGFLCLDGKTKSFDKNGDGYARSEAINVLFLQKAKDAKRIYSEVFHVKEKYFIRPDDNFLPVRNPKDIEIFLNEFYSEINVDPKNVEYVEAFGSGIAEADAKELDAISRVFDKEENIMVGSVKSNMGHSEGASGVCSVTKVCLAFYKGKIPANIHFSEPRENSAITSGKVKVVTENTPFGRGYTAINSFSYTGLNYHVLLKGHFKLKDDSKYRTTVPRLVLASGRTELCVDKILFQLKNQPVDPEQIALLQGLFKVDIPGHLARGYTILESNAKGDTISLSESTCYYPDVRGPVWFLYSGMGSQWAGMGADLMKIPVFAASIERCDQVLRPKGVDIVKIITDPDETIFNDILNAFVGIAAIQIALTDVLKEIGIVPDNIIGHSVGELGCAYADGCLTAEQMILASYYRGMVSKETVFSKGLMAAVRLGHQEVTSLCPPEIETACHNSSDSTTISGPADIVTTFVKELTAKGVFAKEVKTSNIACHSKYIAHAGPKLLSLMNNIIPVPKERSKKWISTSILPKYWDEPQAKYASAEYFTNNLLNHVYFEEAAKSIPENAIIIEIAPHGLLQAILRKSHNSCIHIPLTRRGIDSSTKFLLESIGKLYQSGLNPRIDALYPTVQYPVSTETPLLSHFVGWEHSEEWRLTTFEKNDKTRMIARNVFVSVHDDDWKLIYNFSRNGQKYVPESTYIVLVWETLAMYHEKNYTEMDVTFQNVKFHRNVIIGPEENVLKFRVTIQKGSGGFEVVEEDELIVSGEIIYHKNKFISPVSNNMFTDKISQEDVYRELNCKGYEFLNSNKLIQFVDGTKKFARVQWTGNWLMFLESLIQLNIFVRDNDHTGIPKHISRIQISTDEVKHTRFATFNVSLQNNIITKCSCVKIEEILFNDKLNMETTLLNFNDNIPTKDELIKIAYKGISKQNNSINVLEEEVSDGTEFSGFNDKNEKVMGLVHNKFDNDTVLPDPNLLWPVPNHWSLEDAASVPRSYVYAFYCLVIRGKISKDMTIFISNGAGVLGQALISISLAIGCTVYTVVSSVEKKLLLLNILPKLRENNIVLSNDTYFHTEIIHRTNNMRCDLVINNCENTFVRQNAMKCVGPSGNFFDLSKNDMEENNHFGMSFLWESKNYVSVRLSSIFKPENQKEREAIQKYIIEGLSSGIVKPFTEVLYELDDENTDNLESKSTKNKINNKPKSLDILKADNNTKSKTGLEVFHSYVEKDECEATEPFVIMETQLSKASLKVEGEISDPNENYLIMIPGFEGHHRVFKSICKRIKVQAVTVQLGPNSEAEGIKDIATNILKGLQKFFSLKSNFYILGYSFGVNIALELASLFEMKGFEGVVYCLDSSPDALKLQLDTYLGKITDNNIQNKVIKHVYKLLTGHDETDLNKFLEKTDDWIEKVDKSVTELKKEVNYSHEYIKDIMYSLYNKIVLSKEYEPEYKLESELVLIKSKQEQVNLTNDYGLSKFTKQSVKVFNIEADHASATEDSRVPNIVNKMLDSELLERFKKTNLCETYAGAVKYV